MCIQQQQQQHGNNIAQSVAGEVHAMAMGTKTKQMRIRMRMRIPARQPDRIRGSKQNSQDKYTDIQAEGAAVDDDREKMRGALSCRCKAVLLTLK